MISCISYILFKPIISFQVLSTPFAALSPYLKKEHQQTDDWVGTIKTEQIGGWIDVMLLLILGGIPWQGYMQRVLAIKDTKSAKKLSMYSAVGCTLMAVPPIFIGYYARYEYRHSHHLIESSIKKKHIFFVVAEASIGRTFRHSTGRSLLKNPASYCLWFWGT